MMRKTFAALGVLALMGPSAHAAACKAWGEARQVGALDTKFIKESSGLEWSPMRPGALYHNNDSGDGPNIYTTDLAGKSTIKQKISGIRARDVEDIALGPCPTGNEQCLFFGDIGDGGFSFSKVPRVTLVRESALAKGGSVSPLRTITLSLETGRMDMEGMAVHPNGDLYLATKDYSRPRTTIMRVSRASLSSSSASARIVATVDLSGFGFKGDRYLVTGMDIADDGQSFLLLNYGGVIEVDYDLAKAASKDTELSSQAKFIQVPVLPQQESIAYFGPNAFLYSTEAGAGTPIMRVDCKER